MFFDQLTANAETLGTFWVGAENFDLTVQRRSVAVVNNEFGRAGLDGFLAVQNDELRSKLAELDRPPASNEFECCRKRITFCGGFNGHV